MRTHRARLMTAGVVITVSVQLSGCGSNDVPETSSEASRSSTPPDRGAAPDDKTSGGSTGETEAAEPDLAVTVDGEVITPNAEALSVEVGEPLAISVTADREGELHVHSNPEQYLAYDTGETVVELVVDTPGLVEVEDDDTGAVVAILEVR